MVCAMRKAGVLSILFVVILLAFAVIAEAQQPKKVQRIGYLSNFDPASDSARSEVIRLALRDLGYIEGKNIVIEWRSGKGNRDRQRALAAELVRLKVDVIVTAGPPGTRAAKEANVTLSWGSIMIPLATGSSPV